MSATTHHGLTYDEYRRLPGWNWSLIKEMDKSPRHVLHALRPQDDDTASRAKLRAIHALVLEPENFAASFSVFDGRRTGKLYDAHVEAHPGTAVLNVAEYDEARATADAIRSHAAVRPLLATGHGEVTVTWTDADTCLPCKARLDWLAAGHFLDLKTYGTTDERIVARKVVQMGAHGQMAHYADALDALGMDDPRCFLVVAEGKGPHDVAVFELDRGIPDGALHVGRDLRARLMERLAACVAHDDWPGRHPGIVDLCLPTYALLEPEMTNGDSSALEMP